MNRRSFLQCAAASAVLPIVSLKGFQLAPVRHLGPSSVNETMRAIMYEQRIQFGAWRPAQVKHG
jgi:hypothetical protein